MRRIEVQSYTEKGKPAKRGTVHTSIAKNKGADDGTLHSLCMWALNDQPPLQRVEVLSAEGQRLAKCQQPELGIPMVSFER